MLMPPARTSRPAAAVLLTLAVVASLGFAGAVAAQPRPPANPPPGAYGHPPGPPPEQPAARARSEAPDVPAYAVPPSAVSVMTERQKYCRWQNRCPMQGRPCPPCAGQ